MQTETEIPKNREVLNETDFRLTETFKALGDINRLRIFRILTDHPKFTVGTIAKILDMSVPLTSQHIKVLAHAQLLEKSRTGKHIYSRLDRRNPIVRELVKAMRQCVKTKS